jgi:hypothetical protein
MVTPVHMQLHRDKVNLGSENGSGRVVVRGQESGGVPARAVVDFQVPG